MWGFGVFLAVLASLCGTSGKQLFRYAELKRLEGVALEDVDIQKSNWKFKLGKMTRLLGLIIIAICGPLLDMASYGFAAQSMIAPFAGTDIVANMLLAPFTLNEKWTRTRVGGAIFVATGTIMTAFFGPQEDQAYSRDKIEEILFSWRVLIYLICIAAFVSGNIVFYRRRPPGDTLRGLSLGILSGTLAGNMFCVKATVELIKAAARDGIEVWAHWVPWVCLVGAALFALSNLKFMEQGMREQEALLMGTLYEGSLVLSGCASGSIVLQELEHRTSREISLALVSMAVIFTGICILWFGELKLAASKASDDVKADDSSVASTLGKSGPDGQAQDSPAALTTVVVQDDTPASETAVVAFDNTSEPGEVSENAAVNAEANELK